ncbi:MAG: hypothetical protein LBH25_09990 [Fibromonadaceae bacterium]|jgi:hypothetical protein|nr:hypothetical protein [Fibromonadaceae bacterium]
MYGGGDVADGKEIGKIWFYSVRCVKDLLEAEAAAKAEMQEIEQEHKEELAE